MLVWEIVRVAFGALWANKVRAVLTMLGIVIGVWAVIAMMAIGQGVKQAVQDRIASSGVNQLMIFPGTRKVRGTGRDVPLTTDDAQALAEQMRSARAVVAEMFRSYQVKYRSQNADITVNGTVPGYFAMRGMELAAGRIFNDAEVTGRRLVAVLSEGAMKKLGGGASMVGRYIRIRGIAVQVVGVLKRKGVQGWQPNPDEMIFVPVTTAQFRLMGTGFVLLSVDATSPDRVVSAAEEIERILRRQHRLRRDESDDFRVANMLAIVQTLAETAGIFSLLLAGIAAISLVVGGIGIMNIMLVSVTERTQEIGIRKAVGARRSTILLQFVLEAIVLCTFGGILGIGAGIGAAIVIAAKAGWVTVVTPASVLMALGVSVAVGLFFGIYPAFRASRLDPVEALRYE